VMGGDNAANGNNGLSTKEIFDTASTSSPQIVSLAPFGAADLQVLSTFSYKVIAFGNPRPVLSLVSGPVGLMFHPIDGQMSWTPTTNQVGTHSVLLRATSSAGVAEQTFTLTVTPLPGDMTPPTAPTSFSQVFRSANSVTVTWSGATDNLGVVSYNFYVFVGSRARRWALFASGVTNRSYIANGFTPGAIAAVDAAGNVSPLHIGYTNVLTLPSISHVGIREPTTLIQGSAFLYTVSVSATPSPGFSGFSGPAGMAFTRVVGANTNNDYAVLQWQPNAAQIGTHSFTLFATNANTAGSSATFSVIVLPNGTDAIPPTPVAQISASGIASDRCILSWTPAGDNIGIASYHLIATHFGAPSNHVITLDVPGANTNSPLTGLQPSAGYTVVITPSDAAGNVGPPTSLFFTTLDQADLNLRIALGVIPGTLTLSWNKLGASSTFTVESSDSLTATNWAPVQPTHQWPNAATTLVVTPSANWRFFRLSSTP
jgi:Putative Ig domain